MRWVLAAMVTGTLVVATSAAGAQSSPAEEAPLGPRIDRPGADGEDTERRGARRESERRVDLTGVSEQLRALRRESLDTRASLATSVLSSGVVSVVTGALLTIPDDYDLGLRFAGFNTLAFGAINTVVGSIALVGIERERAWDADPARGVENQTPNGFARYRDHALADESREAWGHGINLGLAGAYGAIGAGAIAASQLGVEHPNRWLGSGIAISVQAAHLLVVDFVGTWEAREYEEAIRSLAPSVSYDPTTGDTRAGVALGGDF